ncbi:hypothetical protein [Pseudonocardia alni]|uniref:hypothetical protein n=1 Tax=Pseudonocardia alni TaxID=33907 RepID=UPI00280B793D|nr:hypothetical protein [Pseudonocardia alni]
MWVGGALIFAYWSTDRALHISIDTTDLSERYLRNPPLRMTLNDAVLYRHTITGASADRRPARVQNLGDEKLFSSSL